MALGDADWAIFGEKDSGMGIAGHQPRRLWLQLSASRNGSATAPTGTPVNSPPATVCARWMERTRHGREPSPAQQWKNAAAAVLPGGLEEKRQRRSRNRRAAPDSARSQSDIAVQRRGVQRLQCWAAAVNPSTTCPGADHPRTRVHALMQVSLSPYSRSGRSVA